MAKDFRTGVRFPPLPPRRSKLYIACSDFFQKSERAHAAAPPFCKRSRSARLFGCKRPHDGLLSLPTFCGLRGFKSTYKKRKNIFFIALRHVVADCISFATTFLCFASKVISHLFRRSSFSAKGHAAPSLLACKRALNASRSLPTCFGYGSSIPTNGTHKISFSRGLDTKTRLFSGFFLFCVAFCVAQYSQNTRFLDLSRASFCCFFHPAYSFHLFPVYLLYDIHLEKSSDF